MNTWKEKFESENESDQSRIFQEPKMSLEMEGLAGIHPEEVQGTHLEASKLQEFFQQPMEDTKIYKKFHKVNEAFAQIWSLLQKRSIFLLTSGVGGFASNDGELYPNLTYRVVSNIGNQNFIGPWEKINVEQ